MDMKRILQAMDGVTNKPVEGADSMAKFLRVVKEAEINQPDPKYAEYAQLMAKYDMLAKEMAPDASGLGVQKGASPDAIASVNAIKAKAAQLAGPNLQAWEQARQKENADSMTQAQANLPAMAAQLENIESTLSPEQLAYNQLRAQLDSADFLRSGNNTFADVSPEVTAKTTAMRTKLAQMAAALKAKGIDAAADYDAPDPAVPAAAPVDLNQKYATEETGMSRFLSIISEAEINQPAVTPIKVPPVPQLPAQDGDQGDGSRLTTNQDGTKTYAGAFGRFTYDAQGKAISYAEPQFTGLGRSIDLTTGQTTQNYNAGPLNTTQTTDAKGNVVSHNTEYDLGVGKMAMGRDAKGITSKSWQGRGEEAKDIVSNKDLYAAGNKDKEATYDRAMAQVKSAPVQEGIDKFLSIVRKNDVSILNEGSNPHKVALPVQMTMQHYQSAEPSTTNKTPSLLKKYFHEVESEVNEQAQAKRQVVNQYASVIAERVLKKGSKKKILNEEESEEQNKRSRYPNYYKHKDRTIFRIDDPTAPKGYRDVHPENDEWDSIYQQEFPDYPLPDENDDSFEKDSVTEAPIAMDPTQPNNPTIHNHQKANTMTLKGRIQQARNQLRELAELAESDELVVWERITRLSKGGMFMGLEQNLEQIRHGISELAAKRKKGGVQSRGISPDIGEGAISKLISKYVVKGTPHEVKLSGGLYNNRDQKVFQQFGAFPDEKAAQEFVRRNNIQDPMIDPIQKSTVDPQLKLKFEELLSKF